jgi:hypothetical protein
MMKKQLQPTRHASKKQTEMDKIGENNLTFLCTFQVPNLWKIPLQVTTFDHPTVPDSDDEKKPAESLHKIPNQVAVRPVTQIAPATYRSTMPQDLAILRKNKQYTTSCVSGTMSNRMSTVPMTRNIRIH